MEEATLEAVDKYEMTIEFPKDAWVHPNYINYILDSTPSAWNSEANTTAIRCWQLGSLFPNMEFKMISEIVANERLFEIMEDKDMNYLHIHKKPTVL